MEKKKWTKEENEKFTYLYNNDYSLAEIAEKLGRSATSVKTQSRNLGLAEQFNLEVLFPREDEEWKFFNDKIKKAENKIELFESLGMFFGETRFLKALKFGVEENHISADEFKDIILRFELNTSIKI